MRVLKGAIVAVALAGSTGAYAQGVYVAEPAPVPYPAPYDTAAPVIVTPVPPPAYVGPGYDYAYAPAPYSGATVVDPRTGRWCSIEPSGYRWCWTP
jgi:hypothetical protein